MWFFFLYILSISNCVTSRIRKKSKLGAGIRPVITIPINELKFIIEKESNYGEIEVINQAIGNEVIDFKVIVNKGFVLKSLIITKESGEEIEVTSDKLEMIDEGEYKISNNSFTMPFENVTIKALFEPNYRFLEGMNQEYDNTGDSILRFRVNMDFSDFSSNGKLFIDEEEVDCSCYDLSEGSTIIEFKQECSKKIAIGNHDIVAKLSNGAEAATELSIINNPETNDSIMNYIYILFISSNLLLVVNKKMKELCSSFLLFVV